jgi:dTDP-4-dehydrorhamnose reductase
VNVLLLGAGGQLGRELQRTCPRHVSLSACDTPDLDFCQPASITRCIAKTAPTHIINAAAYTAVDRAESEPDLADRVNHLAVRQIAGHCRETGIRLIHISTDFVFNGRQGRPYAPHDTPDPLSVYGRSKYRGEQAVLTTLDNVLVIRTAWLYSIFGSNFVKTMLRLMAEKEALSVVVDQIGTPTWAKGLARAVWRAMEKELTGIVHWTDAGTASWYDFAAAIQEEGLSAGLLKTIIPVKPIPSRQFPAAAIRPANGVLDKTASWKQLGMEPPHWRCQLRGMLQEMPLSGSFDPGT